MIGERKHGARPCETAFSYRLTQLRVERGLTVERLAHHCRVSESSMWLWLSDGFEPLLGYAFKVACALGVDLDDLAELRISGSPPRRRADAPGHWTFHGKGSVLSTKFGAGLRIALTADGRTIKAFASDLGLSRCTVNDWTLGNTEPRLTSAMRAASELGLSLHGLCEGRVEAPQRDELNIAGQSGRPGARAT